MNKQLFCVMDDSKKEIEMTPKISQIHNDSINRIKKKYAYLFENNEKTIEPSKKENVITGNVY